MKIFCLIIGLFTVCTTISFCNSNNDFIIKPYNFDFTYSWDAKLLRVSSKAQFLYSVQDSKTTIEIKELVGKIQDKQQGHAKVNFELLSFPIRSTSLNFHKLKRVEYSLIFLFEKQNRQFLIEVDYPFYRRNLEDPELFVKLPTHHRILRRRLNGLAFDLTDQESELKKIFNDKRRDWVLCSSYSINDSSDFFNQKFSSRYELVNETE